jgi:hypothetical protein
LERRCWLWFIHWKRGHGRFKEVNNDKPLFGKFKKKILRAYRKHRLIIQAQSRIKHTSSIDGKHKRDEGCDRIQQSLLK